MLRAGHKARAFAAVNWSSPGDQSSKAFKQWHPDKLDDANEYEIKENGTILVIGAITNITIPEDTLYEDGWVHLQKANGVAINGLDGYTSPQIIDRFTYAKPDKKATSILDK